MDIDKFKKLLETKEKTARANPGRCYFFFDGQTLWGIDHVEAKYDDTDWSGWIARSTSDAFCYTDPVDTKSELVAGLKSNMGNLPGNLAGL